ncbi:hypothetical protein GCM10007386_20360 [Pseudoduganella dura]|nr:hypothetical protein GCM10007386_20360 [Pseudoduganella dura]
MLLACCPLVHAQWEWKDANNVRHFSDQPPPASIPPSRILKAPRGQLPDLRKELAAPPATAPAAPARARPAAAEGDAAATQRKEEAAEAARKAAVEAQNRAASAAACDSARGNLRVLESGVRIATTDRNGEPAFLDDTQKTEQARRNRATVATHCRQ